MKSVAISSLVEARRLSLTLCLGTLTALLRRAAGGGVVPSSAATSFLDNFCPRPLPAEPSATSNGWLSALSEAAVVATSGTLGVALVSALLLFDVASVFV